MVAISPPGIYRGLDRYGYDFHYKKKQDKFGRLLDIPQKELRPAAC